ncbi:MAG: 50S ribosomal protein L24 [Candidatus Sumerlaeia bacterium]|nr:50S ribosomal protein L24 [Candidatus Sumerlaeia bacterium]
MAFRIKKGDTVLVISGKDKGAVGKVLSVQPEKGTAIVENVNFVKRHQRQRTYQRQSGIQEKEAPIYLCKLMLLCPKCNKPTRIGAQITAEGTKVRICRKCGAPV